MAGVLLRPVGRCLCCLELGHHTGQAMGDRVVDLARHPLSFVDHAGVASPLDELAVEIGVLLEGRLEPDDGLSASLTRLSESLAEEPAEADRDRLDDDHGREEDPQLGRPPGEARHGQLDRRRRQEHADDDERRGPKQGCMEEPGDREDQEERADQHEHGRDPEEARQVDRHPDRVGLPWPR